MIVKKITFDKIKELSKKFGFIDIKGWTMADVNESFSNYCKGVWDTSDYINKEFEFDDEHDLYVTIQDAIQAWKYQDLLINSGWG